MEPNLSPNEKIANLINRWVSPMTSVAQIPLKKNDGTSNTNNQSNQNIEAVTYRLFPTQNIWTFIKLNTRNGYMSQVQYSLNDSTRFETRLSLVPLVTTEEEKNGRFTLYPTQNTFNFMLLDQINGRVWQVQWSIVPEKRFVIPIY